MPIPICEEDANVAKPEWGQKRTCSSCGCRFYDLARTPITCPKCGATVEPDVPFKVRRSSSVAPPEPKVVAPVIEDEIVDVDPEEAVVVEEEDEAAEGEEEEAAEDDETGLIEDASDLVDDDDDMAEVMEHMDEEIEDEV
jgi:uncharacterized protein (TIGR02300 family)